MNIHYGRVIDIDEIVNIFATQHPSRLLLRDNLTDEQWDWNEVIHVMWNLFIYAAILKSY